jgi:hypothetical protein
MAYQERQTHRAGQQPRQTTRHGGGDWSRARWLLLAAVVIAIAVVVVFLVLDGGTGHNGPWWSPPLDRTTHAEVGLDDDAVT